MKKVSEIFSEKPVRITESCEDESSEKTFNSVELDDRDQDFISSLL